MEIVLATPVEEIEPLADDLLPLSFAQQRLWFLDQLHPQSAQYNVPSAFRIRGDLEGAALEESLRMIVARHEILRTVYVRIEGGPAQKIVEEPCFEMAREDLSCAAEPGELERRLRQEAARPFDLEHDLMLRATVFKLAERDHVLLINAHHIAFDEWSMQALWLELAACYEACQAGRAPELEELPIQYADFAAWQRERAAQWGPSEKYWREQLSGELPRLKLPGQRPGAERGDQGTRARLTLSRELTSELRALSQREGVTLHVVMLTAFQVLLRRVCAQDDIIIGTPVAGRAHFQTEPLIGFFVNTLPARVRFEGRPTFRELLRRARQASLETCEHQELPFEHIVDLVRAERRPGGNPVFDIVFSTQHSGGSWDFGGLKIEPLEVETGTAKFGLTFVVQDRGDDWAVIAEYSVDLFDARTIRRLLEEYQAVLQAISNDPEAAVAALPQPIAKDHPHQASKALATSSATGSGRPQTRFEKQLRQIWKSVLGHDAFGSADNFFEIGGHSLLAVKLIAQVEKTLGKRLALPILFRAPTIERLAEALAEGDVATPGSCLVEIQPQGTRPPMFWLHTLGGGGGGGLFTYRTLAEALGPDQPSYGFVAPPQPFQSIEEMAARYVQEMRAVQPAGPYHLGGYCFGGVVAYEMARQLEAIGERTATLALLDSSPPDPTGERAKPSLRLAWHAVTTLPGWLWKLDRESLQKHIRRACALFQGRGRPVSSKDRAAQLEQFVDMTHYPENYRRFARAHWLALMNYKPGPYRGGATLFKTDERRLSRLDSVATWRKLMGSGLEVRRVTGKHEQILDHPHAEKLAAQLRQLLDSK